MSVIKTSCSCGEQVEIRTGTDSRSDFRSDCKQAVYTGEDGYNIFRCRGCGEVLDETCSEFAFEERGKGDD